MISKSIPVKIASLYDERSRVVLLWFDINIKHSDEINKCVQSEGQINKTIPSKKPFTKALQKSWKGNENKGTKCQSPFLYWLMQIG